MSFVVLEVAFLVLSFLAVSCLRLPTGLLYRDESSRWRVRQTRRHLVAVRSWPGYDVITSQPGASNFTCEILSVYLVV